MGFIVMVVSFILGILLLVYSVQDMRREETTRRTYMAVILGVLLLGFAVYLFNPLSL